MSSKAKILIIIFFMSVYAVGAYTAFSQDATPENTTSKTQKSYLRKLDNLRQRSMFSDYKAMQVGDAVTVMIVEETEAGSSAGSNESRNSSLSAGVDINTGAQNINVDGGIATGNSFKGSGSNTRKEIIRSKLSARVVDEDSSGNFIIEANRRTKVNGEEQTIKLRGIIRPADVRSDNSIYSYNIMDMELFIDGDGNISKMQQPGLFTKFFRLLF